MSHLWEYQSQECGHTACSWDMDLGSDYFVSLVTVGKWEDVTQASGHHLLATGRAFEG